MSAMPSPTVENSFEEALPNDSIVRLEIEAAQYVVPLNEALQGAYEGKLELLFQRPRDIPRTVLQPWGRDSVVGEIAIAQTPDYMILTQDFCLQLVDRLSAVVTHAHSGYRSRSANKFLTRLHAGDADKSAGSTVQVEGKDFVPPENKFGFWGSWSFRSDGQTVGVPVMPKDVFVRLSEFKRWRLESFYPRTRKSPTRDQSGRISWANSLIDPMMDDDHKSPALLLMCEAAFFLWAHETVIFDNPATFPSDEAVVAWLMDHAEPGTFTRTSAKDAARLVKPTFARRKEVAG